MRRCPQRCGAAVEGKNAACTRLRVSVRAATSSDGNVTASQKKLKPRKPKVVVVGGGWAGFGSAHALQQAGAEVRVLDASPNPGGLSASWKSAGGRTVEPGIKGWVRCGPERHGTAQ